MTQGSPDFSRPIRAFLLVAVVLLGLAILWTYLSEGTEEPSYPYSQLLADAAAGNVDSITQDGTQLTVIIKGDAVPRIVNVASESINVYAEVCAATGNEPGPACSITYTVVAESATGQWLGLLISSLLPVLLIGAFFFFMMRAARSKKE